ncbi:anti-sigma factor domain-containing protein [Hylemonella sp. W303a]|uniref:anti-sigma factor n=1 Tax=Hylemonella sp. W303a TaxID=3389873 RepID=UPI00396B0403
MNWYHNPSVIDSLAAAYVAGTLQGRARRRFDNVMQGQPALAAAVNVWTERLSPLHERLPPQSPSARLWRRIASVTLAPQRAALSWWHRLLAPVPAGALALGLMMGVLAPRVWQAQVLGDGDLQDSGTQLPASYVGVLGTPQGQPGLVISSLRHSRVVDVKQLSPVAVPDGRTLYLWRIDKAGTVTAIGPLPNSAWTHVSLAESAEQVFFPAVELAVSLESLGTRPEAPTQAFVYRGLCGKLWR